MQNVDVFVLGAGISGCVAATLLAKKGYKVVMASRDSGTKYHLPESWVYTPSAILHDLGIEQELLACCKKEASCSFCSADGRLNIDFNVKDLEQNITYGDVVRVDRDRFDQALLKNTIANGVQFLPLARILECVVSHQKAHVVLESAGASYNFDASYFIDASGKSAYLSQVLNLACEEKKLDHRIACFSHFEFESQTPDGFKIIAVDGGYLFCIPLANQRVSIGCVLEEAASKNLTPDDFFAYALSLSPYVTELIGTSKRVLPVIQAKNHQRRCLESAGPSYRIVGDAACFLDPFFCPGIDFAVFSAGLAVESIENNDPEFYKEMLFEWLEQAQKNVYAKIENSHWRGIMRTFADPHLPYCVPLALTQSFTQITHPNRSLVDGIQVSRGAYEMAPC